MVEDATSWRSIKFRTGDFLYRSSSSISKSSHWDQRVLESFVKFSISDLGGQCSEWFSVNSLMGPIATSWFWKSRRSSWDQVSTQLDGAWLVFELPFRSVNVFSWILFICFESARSGQSERWQVNLDKASAFLCLVPGLCSITQS